MPLTCCPQEKLGGLLGGAGREQPHLLQGAQGAGTHCLGEWGARGCWDSRRVPEHREVGGGGQWGQQEERAVEEYRVLW